MFEMKATMDLGCHSPELRGFRRQHCEFVHAGFQTEEQRQRFDRKTSSELFVLFSHHGKEQDVMCLRSHMRPSRSILCLKVIFPMFSKPQAKFYTPHVPSTSSHIHSLHHDRAHDHHDDEHAERSTRSLAIRFPPDTTEAIVQNFFEDVMQRELLTGQVAHILCTADPTTHTHLTIFFFLLRKKAEHSAKTWRHSQFMEGERVQAI